MHLICPKTVIVILVATNLASCGAMYGSGPTSSSYTSGTPVTVGTPSSSTITTSSSSATFSAVQSQVLTPYCSSCHAGGTSPNLSSYSSVMGVVTAGSPSGSQLYTDISGGRMPLGGNSLSATQIQLVSDWITQGAQNN